MHDPAQRGREELGGRRDELLKAFTDNTSTDIDDSKQIFQLLALLFDSRGAAVTEVSFPSTFTMTVLASSFPLTCAEAATSWAV